MGIIATMKSDIKVLSGFLLLLLPSTLILSGDIAWTLAGLVYTLALQSSLRTRKGRAYIRRVVKSLTRI